MPQPAGEPPPWTVRCSGLAQEPGSDVGGDQSGFDGQRARPAERVDDAAPRGGDGRPSGAHQDGRRQGLLERRLGLLAGSPIAAAVQTLARQVDRHDGLVPADVHVGAQVGSRQVDGRAATEPRPELVDDDILGALRAEQRVGHSDGRAETGEVDGERAVRAKGARASRSRSGRSRSRPRRRRAAASRPAAGRVARAATTGRRDSRARAARQTRRRHSPGLRRCGPCPHRPRSCATRRRAAPRRPWPPWRRTAGRRFGVRVSRPHASTCVTPYTRTPRRACGAPTAGAGSAFRARDLAHVAAAAGTRATASRGPSWPPFPWRSTRLPRPAGPSPQAARRAHTCPRGHRLQRPCDTTALAPPHRLGRQGCRRGSAWPQGHRLRRLCDTTPPYQRTRA